MRHCRSSSGRRGSADWASRIWNTRVYVLDRRPCSRCRPGVAGELYIAGSGLGARLPQTARGLNRRTFSSPIRSDCPGSRMYRTGDRGRGWRPDGTLHFSRPCRPSGQDPRLFRHRAPAKIEATLGQHDGVAQAAVVGPRRPLLATSASSATSFAAAGSLRRDATILRQHLAAHPCRITWSPPRSSCSTRLAAHAPAASSIATPFLPPDQQHRHRIHATTNGTGGKNSAHCSPRDPRARGAWASMTTSSTLGRVTRCSPSRLGQAAASCNEIRSDFPITAVYYTTPVVRDLAAMLDLDGTFRPAPRICPRDNLPSVAHQAVRCAPRAVQAQNAIFPDRSHRLRRQSSSLFHAAPGDRRAYRLPRPAPADQRSAETPFCGRRSISESFSACWDEASVSRS